MLKAVKRFIKAKIWRHRNPHNLTTLAGYNFSLDRVSVGKMSYGPIHAICFGGVNERLEIGSYCSIAEEVVFLLGGGHAMDTLSTYPFRAKCIGDLQAVAKGPIVIGDDVWIGYGATILSGVTLGKGCVVGARALVCKDVPPYAVVAGVPARIIKYRFSEETISVLEGLKLDDIDEEFIRDNITLLEEEVDDVVLDELKGMLS